MKVRQISLPFQIFHLIQQRDPAETILVTNSNTFQNVNNNHDYCNVLTPKQYSVWFTALSLYKLYNTKLPLSEYNNLSLNTRHNIRTHSIHFTSNNRSRLGLNRSSNRYVILNRMLKTEDLSLPLVSYKAKLKQLIRSR